MKRFFGIIAAIVWGCLVGFFGVFVSVFADGGISERLMTIAAILVIYLISGGVWAFFGGSWSWQWTIPLGVPGMAILLMYSASEPPLLPYFILYSALIAVFGIFGTVISGNLRRRFGKMKKGL